MRLLAASIVLLSSACYSGAGEATPEGSSSETEAPTTTADDPSTTGSTLPPADEGTSTSGASTSGADSSGTGDPAEGSDSSTGDPGGPTSSFCGCSTDNPAADAGSFEMCAELLPDGRGTYYELAPYTRTEDAETQPGVPQGMMTAASFSGSAVYPNTTWDYWVYVPDQYDGSEPAALLVLTDGNVYRRNDGSAPYRTPTVLDNLIDEGAMPMTIAVFVDPGQSNGNSTRSLEYDTPDPNYVTFLLDELLPEAVGGYAITDDPDRRAIGGRSSGGAAAFTAGWERPDAFRLIYTTIGSFVQLRANADGEFSDRYPDLIAAEPPLPLRVTLLSGSEDLDNQFGNWRDAHMAMTTALDCAGYTYRSGFGEGGHGDQFHPYHAFGRDMRWLFAETVGNE